MCTLRGGILVPDKNALTSAWWLREGPWGNSNRERNEVFTRRYDVCPRLGRLLDVRESIQRHRLIACKKGEMACPPTPHLPTPTLIHPPLPPPHLATHPSIHPPSYPPTHSSVCFLNFCFVVCVSAHMYVSSMHTLEARRAHWISTGTVANCHVGAGNPTGVLCKCSEHS